MLLNSFKYCYSICFRLWDKMFVKLRFRFNPFYNLYFSHFITIILTIKKYHLLKFLKLINYTINFKLVLSLFLAYLRRVLIYLLVFIHLITLSFKIGVFIKVFF